MTPPPVRPPSGNEGGRDPGERGARAPGAPPRGARERGGREFRLSGPEDATPCTNCGVVFERRELDRLRWCPGCIAASKARAVTVGWGIGVLVALAAGAWIWITVRPTALVPAVWVAILVALLGLAARFGREIMYGIYRARGGPRGKPPA